MDKHKKRKVDLAQYYRWQFLRRNKNYQQDYDLFKRILDERPDMPLQKAEFESEIYEKYGINGLYDYRAKVPLSDLKIDGNFDFVVQKGSLKKIFGPNLGNGQQINGPYLIEKLKSPEGNSTIVQKYVEFVLNYDAKLSDIHREIERIVKSTQLFRRKILKSKRPKKLSGKNKNTYEILLKVHDLRQRYSNVQVAKKLYPNEVLRDAEGKVDKEYKRALVLIQSEYRSIAF